MGEMRKRENSRLGAGLGAAGLASGLSSSHFEVGVWGGLERVVVTCGGRMELVLSVWRAWSVETMDCLLLSGGGAVL
jgi:hypothetical protein